MSIQDDVFEVNNALLQRADLLYQKPSLKEDEPIYKSFQSIVERLWQYEAQLEDAEETIAAQQHLIQRALSRNL